MYTDAHLHFDPSGETNYRIERNANIWIEHAISKPKLRIHTDETSAGARAKYPHYQMVLPLDSYEQIRELAQDLEAVADELEKGEYKEPTDLDIDTSDQPQKLEKLDVDDLSEAEIREWIGSDSSAKEALLSELLEECDTTDLETLRSRLSEDFELYNKQVVQSLINDLDVLESSLKDDTTEGDGSE